MHAHCCFVAYCFIVMLDYVQMCVCCRLQMPNKVQLEADHHQRITTRFTLADVTTSKTITAHQTFVRLTNQKTKQEVIFVAEEDGASAYRFDLVSLFQLS